MYFIRIVRDHSKLRNAKLSDVNMIKQPDASLKVGPTPTKKFVFIHLSPLTLIRSNFLTLIRGLLGRVA